VPLESFKAWRLGCIIGEKAPRARSREKLVAFHFSDIPSAASGSSPSTIADSKQADMDLFHQIQAQSAFFEIFEADFV
jgi:hypothetical protein